jgi:serine/threonine protein kinase
MPDDRDEPTEIAATELAATERAQATPLNMEPTVAAAAQPGPPSHTRSRELHVGSVVKDRFVLEAMIGRGGMGVIYKARDRRKEEAMDRDPYVAVKVLSEDFKSHPEALISLQREAKKAQMLAHPNIVTVYDFDRDGDNVYMTMQWLDGKPLDRLLRESRPDPLPRDLALGLIEGMAMGLAYAHKRGIVHSDFKPGNVFVTRDHEAKILDFGIARAVARPQQRLEATVFDPASLGALTPAYASCEMLEHRDPDPRDDIFALACVAYELLSGQHPFERKMATMARAARMQPAEIPNLTKEQWSALQHGLSFEREERTASARELLAGLVAVPIPKPSRGNRLGALLLGVTLIAGLGAALWYLDPFGERMAITGMQLPPPPSPRVLSKAEKDELEERLLVGEVQFEQGRDVDPWYLYEAHQAYLDALAIDPTNAVAHKGLMDSAPLMAREAARDASHGGWEKWLEALGAMFRVPLIASSEEDVRTLTRFADAGRRGLIAAIRLLVDRARQGDGIDVWDKAWTAITNAQRLSLVQQDPETVRQLGIFQEIVQPHASQELVRLAR